MQIKRQINAASVALALFVMATIHSVSTALAGGDTNPPPATKTQYKFTTIDIDGAVLPYPFAINDDGWVSGFYSDTNGYFHGFLWRKGTTTVIDAPGKWLDTYLGAMNNEGVAIGNFDDDLTVSHAALFHMHAQTWKELPDIPGIPLNYGNGINNNGIAVGAAYQGTPTNSLDGVGWIWNGHTYSFIIVPTGVGTTTGTYPSAINDGGLVTGYYQDHENAYHGFLTRGGAITSFDVPGSDATFGYGINNADDVVGPYNVGQVPNGYIMHAGKFVTVNVPGAASTALAAINNLGVLVGYSSDTNGNQTAFLATPVER
jgi:uncharacterized membrane protein